MRGECPVHWTSEVTEFPAAAGFGSVTRADDVYAVSRAWEPISPELGGVVAINEVFPIELPGRCSSAWTRQSTTG